MLRPGAGANLMGWKSSRKAGVAGAFPTSGGGVGVGDVARVAACGALYV